ncbi:hypothetical protein QYF36_004225 [Acer negundo]|nr:hypothetical protein QYF36_004225 [Acer negundo]
MAMELDGLLPSSFFNLTTHHKSTLSVLGRPLVEFASHVVLVAGQCQNDQLSFLLQLKSSLNFNGSQSVHLVKWNQSTDCCNWSGVDCDAGGRVIGLNLSNESISGGIENSTDLFGLQHLQRLDLAYNRFNGSQIPSRLANLSNLTFLNLSNAGFAGQIPIAISSLTRISRCLENYSNKSQPPASHSSSEFDWRFILMGIGFGIGSGLVVAPIMFSKKVNRYCDNHIDKILMVILPMVGLVYTNSHQRRIQAEEIPEDEKTDEDEEEDYEFEPETEEFRGRYCVLCSKLDITRKKAIHDPNCTCHDSPPTSFSSTTSSSSSSLAVLR